MDTKNLKHVNNDSDFDVTLGKTVDDPKLVVVEFYTTWCPYCRDMAPYFRQFADAYPNTIFVKVNAERCRSVTAQYNLKGYPTFVLYKKKELIDRFEGKDPGRLEREIKKYGLTSRSMEQEATTSRGTETPRAARTEISNVSSYLDKKNCRCFNDLAVSSFLGFLDGRKLISGRGVGKVLMVYVFTQPILLKYFKIKAAKVSAPKSLSFYPDQPMTLDFEDIALLTPLLEITLTDADIAGENKLDLSALGGKPLSVLHVLIGETVGHRKTELEAMNFFGVPTTTSANDHPRKKIV